MSDHTDQTPEPCLHRIFDALIVVNRLFNDPEAEIQDTHPPDSYSVDVKVHCQECNEPFVWLGTGIGLMPDRPMTSVDKTQLRAPIQPASADPDHPMGMAGFTMREVG